MTCPPPSAAIDADGVGEETVEVDRRTRGRATSFDRPLAVVVAGEVRVRVAPVVEEPAVATGQRVHPRPRVVAERDDPGGVLRGSCERAHALDVGG